MFPCLLSAVHMGTTFDLHQLLLQGCTLMVKSTAVLHLQSHWTSTRYPPRSCRHTYRVCRRVLGPASVRPQVQHSQATCRAAQIQLGPQLGRSQVSHSLATRGAPLVSLGPQAVSSQVLYSRAACQNLCQQLERIRPWLRGPVMAWTPRISNGIAL